MRALQKLPATYMMETTPEKKITSKNKTQHSELDTLILKWICGNAPVGLAQLPKHDIPSNAIRQHILAD
jgi:hypothetical protein